MALSPQEAADLRKQLQEIEKLSRLLNKNIDTTSLQDLERQAGNIRAIFSALTDEFEDLTGSIGYAATGFKKLVQEITNSNIGVRETTKALNKLSSISEKIQSYQKGYSDLTSKDLKKVKEQFDIEKQRLFNTQDILKDKKVLLEAEKQNLTIQRNAAISAARAAQARNDRAGMATAISEARRLENRVSKINSEYQKTEASIATNNNLLAEQDVLLQGLEKSIERTNSELKQQEKLLGLSGAVIGGLKKSLDKLGFGGLAQQLGIDEASDKMKALSREIIENKQKESNLQSDINKANTRNLSAAQIRAGFGGKALKDQQRELDVLKSSNDQYNGMSGKFKILQTGIRSMGKSLITNLKDPLSITLFLVGQMVDALKLSDSSTGDLAKSFNKSYSEASSIRQELNNVANLSMDAAVTTQGLQESMVAVGKALGSNAKLNEQDLVIMTKLTKQAGYTYDELMEIQKISLINGKTLEDNTSEILGSAKAYAAQNKLVVNEKDVLREVNKASASLKLSLGGSTKALAEAVVKSKQFGINLEQASQISNALLQFEDSITSELEAELLLGKSLNFEKARALALEGKTADAAAEVLKEVKSSEEFGKLNVIQQEALAKAVGMTKDELAGSLIEREALNKLSEFEGETAKERYDNAVKQYGIEGARKKLGKDALADQFEQQSLQERFNQSIEKLKDVFVSLADPVLQIVKPLADLVSVILPAVNFLLSPLIEGFSLIGQLVSGFVNGLKEGQPVMVGLAAALVALLAPSIMTAIFGIFSAFAKIPFGLGIPLAITAVAGMISLATKSASQVKSIKDGEIDPKGGLVVSGEKGSIQLDPNDSIVAGTDLLGKNNNNQSQQQSVAIDYDRLAAAMSKIQISNTLTVDKQVLANTVNSTNNTTSVQIQ
jgi:hypothetical protein